jgi:hypothetical protein
MTSGIIPIGLTKRIIPLNEIVLNDNLNITRLKKKFDVDHNDPIMGIYAFWLLNDLDKTIKLNKVISLIGPDERPTFSIWQDNLTRDSDQMCLYIGKTANFTDRIAMHLMLGTDNWYCPEKPGELLEKLNELKKKHDNTDFIFKRNSQCQFRAGFEHLFKRVISDDERRSILTNHIGISFHEIRPEDGGYDLSINERYYLENLCIGYFRPWFNLDSER